MSLRFLLISAACVVLSLVLCSCNDCEQVCEPCPRTAPPHVVCSEAPTAKSNSDNGEAQRAAELAREIAQLREQVKAEEFHSSPLLHDRGWYPALLELLKSTIRRPQNDPSLIQIWKGTLPRPRSEWDLDIMFDGSNLPSKKSVGENKATVPGPELPEGLDRLGNKSNSWKVDVDIRETLTKKLVSLSFSRLSAIWSRAYVEEARDDLLNVHLLITGWDWKPPTVVSPRMLERDLSFPIESWQSWGIGLPRF